MLDGKATVKDLYSYKKEGQKLSQSSYISSYIYIYILLQDTSLLDCETSL